MYIYFLLKYFGRDTCLWLFWRSCSLVAFVCMYNGPLNGQLSSVQSCCIKNYITPLLLIKHPIQFYYRYVINDILGIWKDMGWYCWLVFLCWYCWLVFLCWYCCLVFLCWYYWMVVFWMYLCFYWSPLVIIHVCDFSKEFSFWCIWMYAQCSSEGTIIQCSIMLY